MSVFVDRIVKNSWLSFPPFLRLVVRQAITELSECGNYVEKLRLWHYKWLNRLSEISGQVHGSSRSKSFFCGIIVFFFGVYDDASWKGFTFCFALL